MNDQSLNHTRWNCKYHVVFAPKFRRKLIYGEYRKAIGDILRKLCEYKGIEIVEANACVDHIHNVHQDTTKVQRGSDYGISEGEECADDIRAVSPPAI